MERREGVLYVWMAMPDETSAWIAGYVLDYVTAITNRRRRTLSGLTATATLELGWSGPVGVFDTPPRPAVRRSDEGLHGWR